MLHEYSAGEVAEMLGIPYYKVIRKIKRGGLKGSRKVGWGWIIPASALQSGTEIDVQLISNKFEMVKS